MYRVCNMLSASLGVLFIWKEVEWHSVCCELGCRLGVHFVPGSVSRLTQGGFVIQKFGSLVQGVEFHIRWDTVSLLTLSNCQFINRHIIHQCVSFLGVPRICVVCRWKYEVLWHIRRIFLSCWQEKELKWIFLHVGCRFGHFRKCTIRVVKNWLQKKIVTIRCAYTRFSKDCSSLTV